MGMLKIVKQKLRKLHTSLVNLGLPKSLILAEGINRNLKELP